MVDWLSLTIPFAYLGVLLGSLATFSSLNRRRKAVQASTLQPWFPPHLQRDIYFSLLHMEPASASASTSTSAAGGKEKEKKKISAVPETVLKAALLRRAVEDIRRLMELRSQKPALSNLLQKGSVGDDLWQRFLRAEKEMEEEFRDVISEASAFSQDWGQTIFQSANEMYLNATFREKINGVQATADEEREWWSRKKASIQEGFMKELDGEGAESTASASATAAATATTKPGASKPVSDDDTVLVEGGGPAAASGTGGGKKKKKGKK